MTTTTFFCAVGIVQSVSSSPVSSTASPAVFFLRALFRLDRAVLVVSQPHQILDGNFIVDQNLDRSRAVQLFQRMHRLDHGQRASVAQSIDQNHDNTSSNLLFKKFLLF